MTNAAITAGAGGQRGHQVDLREQLDVVASPRGACLHEVLVGVAPEAGTHEHVDHVVHVHLCFARREALRRGQRSSQVRMTAVVVVRARQEMVGVGIAARPDDVVDARSELVDPVPIKGIAGNRCHRPQPRQVAPEAIAGADVRGVERPRLPAVEAFRQVICVPQVQVTHLRAVHGDDAKEVAGRHAERARVSRRHGQCVHRGHTAANGLVERPVVGRQAVQWVDRHGAYGAPRSCIRRLGMLRGMHHRLLLPAGRSRVQPDPGNHRFSVSQPARNRASRLHA